MTAIALLNDWVVRRAEHYGFVALWRGLRLVAADASTVRFGLRASHVNRAALADQIAFGLFLPGSELMLAASLHSVLTSERQMLFEHLDRLSSRDLLLLDRGLSLPLAGGGIESARNPVLHAGREIRQRRLRLRA